MTSESIVVDIDDFCDAHAPWALPLLDRLYQESGGRFKATLFTIPAKTSPSVLLDTLTRPWLEVAVHGWAHEGPECAEWDLPRAQQVLEACGAPFIQFAKVFKAPHWIASPATYFALRDAGWTIADHPRNALTIPAGLRRYVLSDDHRLGVPHRILPVIQAHGHFTADGVDNGLREHFHQFRMLAQWGIPYTFVSEAAT